MYIKIEKLHKKTNNYLPVTEIILDDMQTSSKEISNSSQLPEKSCDASLIQVRKNVRKSHKSVQKTNNELSGSEIISSDMPPPTEEISCSPQLHEENKHEASFAPEKRNKRKSSKPMRKASHDLENISNDINEQSADRISGILALPEKKNNISALLEKIKSRKLNSPENNTNNTSYNADALLDEIKNRASNVSKKNVKNASTLLDDIKSKASKQIKNNTSTSLDKDSDRVLPCSNVNKSIQDKEDENKDTEDNVDGVIFLPEKNRNTISVLKNKRKKNENNVVQLPDKNKDNVLVMKEKICISEVLSEKNENSSSVIQNNEERSESDLSPVSDDNNVLPLSEENSNLEESGSSLSVLQDKKEKSESDMSPLTDSKDSLLLSSGENSLNSPLPFQDRSSDSVMVVGEGSRNTLVTTPEEITISSDSSVSSDQYHNRESETQETAANCVLDLAEKNLIT